jgi:hypothetical protein
VKEEGKERGKGAKMDFNVENEIQVRVTSLCNNQTTICDVENNEL